jgi:hypothetical protein
MGGDADFILPLRDRVKAGEVFGPEIVASGPMVDNAPPDFPYRLHVTNADEARVAVRELKRLGVDFIKVHDHTPREVFFAAIAEAPQGGCWAVCAHTIQPGIGRPGFQSREPAVVPDGCSQGWP